jgi:hypothetical protein
MVLEAGKCQEHGTNKWEPCVASIPGRKCEGEQMCAAGREHEVD